MLFLNDNQREYLQEWLENKFLTFLNQQTSFLNCAAVTKTFTVVKGPLVIKESWNL